MNFDQYIKKLKQARELENKNDNHKKFSLITNDVINSIDNKSKNLTNDELIAKIEKLEDENSKITSILGELTSLCVDFVTGIKEGSKHIVIKLSQIEQCPTIKHELKKLNNN